MNKIQNTTTNLEPPPDAFEVPIWVLQLVGIAIAIIVIFIIYKKRYELKQFIELALGRAVIERYLVYEGSEYDAENAPRNQWKNERIVSWEMRILFGSYPFMLPVLIFSPWIGVLVIISIAALIGSMEIWRRLMAYYEVKRYGPSLHLKIYYQDIDGNEGELFLDNVQMSDRLGIKPLTLITRANAQEHVIRAGIDERQITAQHTEKYLSENDQQKLRKLRIRASERDHQITDSVSTMDFLRRYFDLGETDPEEEIPDDIKKLLDELKDDIMAIEIPKDIDPQDLEMLPTLSIYPGEKLFWKEKQMQEVKDEKTGKMVNKEVEVEVERDPNYVLDPVKVIWQVLNEDGINPTDNDLLLFSDGYVTKSMNKTLKKLYELAKDHDDQFIRRLKEEELIKRYFAISIPYFSGEKDIIHRYEPHIYSAYPNGDLRRRCIIVFPVAFGEAVKKESKIHVAFDYTAFAGIGGVIEAVRLDPVEDILLKDAIIQGIKIQLPDEMFALTMNVPLFIATACDYTDELAREGLRSTRPPAEVGMFAQVVKSLTDVKSILIKLGSAYREIKRLRTGQKEDKLKEETDKIEEELDYGSLIDQSKLPTREIRVEVPYPQKKMIALILIGVVLGVIMTLVIIRILGLTIINAISVNMQSIEPLLSNTQVFDQKVTT